MGGEAGEVSRAGAKGWVRLDLEPKGLLFMSKEMTQSWRRLGVSRRNWALSALLHPSLLKKPPQNENKSVAPR